MTASRTHDSARGAASTSRPRVVAAHAVGVLFVLLVGVLSSAWGERTPMSDGLGWDGANYGRFARDFWNEVFVRGVDPYLLQRTLPSGIVHYGLRLFGQPTDNPHVIVGFQVFNVVLLTLCAALWLPIADRLQLRPVGRVIGFAGLFLNYAALKHAWYLPVFTDVTAFAIGMLAVWLFLASRQAGLAGLAVAGAFAWPSTWLSLLPLIVAPVRSVDPPSAARSRLSWLMAFGVAGTLTAAFLYMFAVRGIRKVGWGPTIPVVEWLVPLSVALFIAHIVAGVQGLTRGVTVAWVVRVARSLRPVHLVLAALAILLPRAIAEALPEGVAGTLDLRAFARYLVFLPNTRPYVFMVSHVVYFGPVLLLLYFLWRPFCRRVQRAGPGAIAFMLVALVLSLTSESRQSNLAAPFVMAMLAAAADDAGLRMRTAGFLALVGVATSKFWIDINGSNTEYDAVLQGERRFDAYFMSDGPWMSNHWYLVQGALVVVVAFALLLLVRADVARMRRERRPDDTPDAAHDGSGSPNFAPPGAATFAQ